MLLLPVPVELMLFEEDGDPPGNELMLLIFIDVLAVLLLVALPLVAEPPVVLPETVALPLLAYW